MAAPTGWCDRDGSASFFFRQLEFESDGQWSRFGRDDDDFISTMDRHMLGSVASHAPH